MLASVLLRNFALNVRAIDPFVMRTPRSIDVMNLIGVWVPYYFWPQPLLAWDAAMTRYPAAAISKGEEKTPGIN